MNLLEADDIVKGLPDEVLREKALRPDGMIPPFIALSEVQRRDQMRKRHASSKVEDTTVAEDILGAGIGSVPTPPQVGGGIAAVHSPPPAAPAPQPRSFPVPQSKVHTPVAQFAEGGIVTLQDRINAIGEKSLPPDPSFKVTTPTPDYSGIAAVKPVADVAMLPQRADYSGIIGAARERADRARLAAKERARNQALLGIGTGIMGAARPEQFAAAVQQAGNQAFDTMEAGRLESIAEQQLADQAMISQQQDQTRTDIANSQVAIANAAREQRTSALSAELAVREKERIDKATFEQAGLSLEAMTMAHRAKLESAIAGIDQAYKQASLTATIEEIRTRDEQARLIGTLRTLDPQTLEFLVEAEAKAAATKSGLKPEEINSKTIIPFYSQATKKVLSELSGVKVGRASTSEELTGEELLQKLRDMRDEDANRGSTDMAGAGG